MAKLSANVIECNSLTSSQKEDMYLLFSEYYSGISPELFEYDLSEKSHVIILQSNNHLRGFSTLSLIETDQYRALFSGDTIIHHDYWGEQALALAFCSFAGKVKAQKIQLPLYWFLISKGYRTYRYLHLFSKTYLPCYRQTCAPEWKKILDILAISKFGKFYDPDTCIIRFPQSRGHLKPIWADIRNNMLDRPEVNFFLQQNPGFAEGNELACITLLEENNLRSFARSAFLTGLHQPSDIFPAKTTESNEQQIKA